jgi:hypothetical protein
MSGPMVEVHAPERHHDGRWRVSAVAYILGAPLEIAVLAPDALVAKAWVRAQAALAARMGPGPESGYPTAPKGATAALKRLGAGHVGYAPDLDGDDDPIAALLGFDGELDDDLDVLPALFAEIDVGDDWPGLDDDLALFGELAGGGWGDVGAIDDDPDLVAELHRLSRRRRGARPY